MGFGISFFISKAWERDYMAVMEATTGLIPVIIDIPCLKALGQYEAKSEAPRVTYL